ncbi:unnamed protein product [Merluccius merluccius]
MLDSLIFLLEKLVLLAHVTVSSLLKGGEPPAKHFERAGTPSQPPQTQTQTQNHHSSSFQAGDLLEVPRTLFTHFGIYLGDDRVAHLIPDVLPALTRGGPGGGGGGGGGLQVRGMVTNTRLLLGVLSKSASVRVDTVEDFAYGAAILLNAMDRVAPRPPLAGAEVARRAEKLVGGVTYSLLWNNCEHFVTYCRYGAAASRQTEQFCEWCKSLIRDQRCLLLSVLVGVASMLCCGVSLGTTLPSFLVPFTLWMVS